MKLDNRLWNPDGGEAEWLRLIDFINPGSEAVKTVIAQAKAEAPNGEFPAYAPPDGWNKTIADLVKLQVEAIYETLREQGIGYAVERWDSQPPAQVIRTHEEILDSEGIGGPCIDLVVLMAACLEAVGIQPLVIVLEEEKERRRHAVLGYRLEECLYGPETPAYKMPPPLLSKQEIRTLKNTGEVEFINCTGITRGEDVDFKEARDQGKGYVESAEPVERSRYKEHWQVIFALDVQVARRTALTWEMQDYLGQVQADALTLPPAFRFPPEASFPKIRVRVKVRKGERHYSEAEVRARERARREGDEESVKKVYQYPHPGPEEWEREAERPMDWDCEVRGRLKRVVVLGDPGFGKTWLLKHEALELAEEALKKLKEYPLATDEIKLPIFLSLAQLAEQAADARGQHLPLDKALVPALEPRYTIGKELKKRIEGNLDSERLVLLLDALDEVIPSERQQELCKRLDEFARKYNRTQILLTSRLVGYPGLPFPLPPREGEFELLPFDHRQQREFVKAWFAGRPGRGDLFLRKLRESPQLYTLAGVPLLLALMCRLFDERDELPRSRAELYEACIWGILTQKWKEWKDEKVPSSEEPYLDAKLELSEEVAFTLFCNEKELFSLRDVRSAINRVFQERPDLREELGKGAAALVHELEENGLLIKAGAGVNPPYLFLHLTFQEYLTACALARRKKLTNFNEKQVPEWLKIVKPHFFDPRWEEVIRLLAAKLEDATPLIQAIWQEPEDIFLGRLLLAGKCLVGARHVQKELHKEITEGVLEHIYQGNENFLGVARMLAATFDEIFHSFIIMLETEETDREMLIRSLTLSTKAESYLIELLQSKQLKIRKAAVQALGEIKSMKAIPSLIGLLKTEQDSSIREAVVEVLGQFAWELEPCQIESKEVMSYLIQALQDRDPRVREIAARSLGENGSQAAASHLIRLLRDKDEDFHVRIAAAVALGQLRHRDAAPYLIDLCQQHYLPYLPEMTSQRSWSLFDLCAIMGALGEIRSEAAIPCLVQVLLNIYAEPYVREVAARALRQIGGRKVLDCVRSGAVPFYLLVADEPEEAARYAWEWAGGEIESPAAVPHLIGLLRSSDDPIVVGLAAWALARIGSKAAVPGLLHLVELAEQQALIARSHLLPAPIGLREREDAAVWVLGEIGSEEAVPCLISLLKDYKQEERPIQDPIRKTAAIALGKIARKTGSSYYLTSLLEDPDPIVREEVAPLLVVPVLGVIGSEQDIQPLYDLLHSERGSVVEEAWSALRAISRKQGIRILSDGSWVKVR